MQSWLWYFISISIMHFPPAIIGVCLQKSSYYAVSFYSIFRWEWDFCALHSVQLFGQYKRVKFNTEICPLEIARRKSFLAFHAWYSLSRSFSFISNEDRYTLFIFKNFKLSRAVTKIRCDFMRMRIIVSCIATNNKLKTLFCASKIILFKFINF